MLSLTDLAEGLDEPGSLDVVPVCDEPRDGGVGDDHVLEGGVPRQVHVHARQEVVQGDTLGTQLCNI